MAGAPIRMIKEGSIFLSSPLSPTQGERVRKKGSAVESPALSPNPSPACGRGE